MIAFVFPGQGSQSVGMLAALDRAYPVVAETFAVVSEVCGRDLWEVAQQGPEERLNETRITQPAMLAAGVATWRVWEACGGARPRWVAGHSLGEYSALVAAEALDLADAAGLVAERAAAMQRAVPAGAGAMAAVLRLDDEEVSALCARAARPGEPVTPANLNAPGQVVVAGTAAAVDRVLGEVDRAGGRSVRIRMSVPSHCPLMAPARAALEARLAATPIRSPAIPVLHNADVETHDAPEAIRRILAEQLVRPVRWTETIRVLAAKGVTRIAECGPGKVLSGLVRRIDGTIDVRNLLDPEGIAAVASDWR